MILQNIIHFLKNRNTPVVLNLEVKDSSKFESEHIDISSSKRIQEAIINYDGDVKESDAEFLQSFKSL